MFPYKIGNGDTERYSHHTTKRCASSFFVTPGASIQERSITRRSEIMMNRCHGTSCALYFFGMKTISPFTFTELLVSGALFCLPLTALAADSVTVEHNSPSRIGKWVLYYPGGVLHDDDINVNKMKQTVYPKPGELTLSIVPPAGATLTISVYKDDELIKKEEGQQISATSEEGHSYRFYVQYAFTKQGTIGVTSVPNGILVRLVRSDGRRFIGRTPKTFENMYAGQYAVYVNAAPGCAKPRPYTKLLKEGERLVINVELPCDLDKRRLAADKPLISRRALKDGLDAAAKERAAKRQEAQDMLKKAADAKGQ